MRGFVWVAAAAATFGLGAVARADSKVAVLEFEGRVGKQVRQAVLDVLDEHGVDVVTSKRLATTAKRSGAELDTEAGRVRVARKLKLNAFIAGDVEQVKRNVKVTLTIYGASDGMQAAELKLSAPRNVVAREVRDTLWEQLGPVLDATSRAEPEPEFEEVPTAPEPVAQPTPPTRTRTPARQGPEQTAAADEEPEDEAVPDDDDEPSRPSVLAALEIGVGARMGRRDFAYNEPMPGLSDYHLDFGTNLSLRARWYPIAHFSDGVMSNIGLDVRGDVLVGVTSTNRQREKFSNSANSFGVALRGRLPLERLELGALFGYGRHAFSFESDGDSDPNVPSVSYGFLRVGADARWSLTDMLALQAQTAYLVNMDYGEIAERPWFPHTSGGGFELELGAVLMWSKTLGVEAAFVWQRYFMSFNPEPDDPGVRGRGRVAGGALDQFLSGRVGMLLRL